MIVKWLYHEARTWRFILVFLCLVCLSNIGVQFTEEKCEKSILYCCGTQTVARGHHGTREFTRRWEKERLFFPFSIGGRQPLHIQLYVSLSKVRWQIARWIRVESHGFTISCQCADSFLISVLNRNSLYSTRPRLYEHTITYPIVLCLQPKLPDRHN